ncbi:Polypeptide N-acetylgalactosaminyltransferase 18 [Bagarius yarrelli]|uniref:Polypeptide N-acetylgalactosaminyltransferase 18 n=1 Tax=Bagarius yarrelli TaxID=175774 RepID=A0A556V9Z4_BAGYA|nr:Polypeptide N-acetylgalactosaminyltransferase 18 [Bagarius yarrelli]
MACTRRTKTLVSTCVILSGMTNIVCLLYVGWVTNYIASVYIKVPMPVPARKLEGDKKGETLRIIERLDRLENVVNQHIQGVIVVVGGVSASHVCELDFLVQRFGDESLGTATLFSVIPLVGLKL